MEPKEIYGVASKDGKPAASLFKDLCLNLKAF